MRKKNISDKKRAHRRVKTGVLAIFLLLLGMMTIAGTFAFLTDSTANLKNIFTPSHVTCEVSEEFADNVKKNVTVKNTGDIDAFVRVKLVSYRVNDADQRIGGRTQENIVFKLGEGWFEKEGFYYYSSPVAPGAFPAVPLIGNSGIQLGEYSTSDVDGGKQVIEVLAEAIQAKGEKGDSAAVELAWNVTFDPDTRTIGK